MTFEIEGLFGYMIKVNLVTEKNKLRSIILKYICTNFSFNTQVLYKFYVETGETENDMLKKFKKYQRLAEIYYVYHSIHMYAVSLHILFDKRFFKTMR